MSSNMKKELVWSIKKGLLRFSSDKIFKIAMALTPLPHRDPVKLDKKDEGLFWLHLLIYIYRSPAWARGHGFVTVWKIMKSMKDAVDAVIVSSSHHVETAEEEVEVTVHHTQPNVTAKLTVNADTQATAIDTSTMPDGATFLSVVSIVLHSPSRKMQFFCDCCGQKSLIMRHIFLKNVMEYTGIFMQF